MKLWKIDVDPVRVLGVEVEKSAVFHYLRVHRIFKAVREIRPVKLLVAALWQPDIEIAPFFGNIGGIASQYHYTEKGQEAVAKPGQ